MALVGYEWIILLVLFLVVIYIISRLLRRNPKPQAYAGPVQQPTTIIKEREVIREVVMVPCKYCGGLMPQASTFCPKCGAGQR